MSTWKLTEHLKSSIKNELLFYGSFLLQFFYRICPGDLFH